MIAYFININPTLWLLSIILTITISAITVKILKKKSPKSLDEDKDPTVTIINGIIIFIISVVISLGVHVLQLYVFVKNVNQIAVENYVITRSDNTLNFTKLGSDQNTELYYKEGYKTPYDKNIMSYLQPLKEEAQFKILNETNRNIRIVSTFDKDEFDINLKTYPELFKMIKNLKK